MTRYESRRWGAYTIQSTKVNNKKTWAVKFKDLTMATVTDLDDGCRVCKDTLLLLPKPPSSKNKVRVRVLWRGGVSKVRQISFSTTSTWPVDRSIVHHFRNFDLFRSMCHRMSSLIASREIESTIFGPIVWVIIVVNQLLSVDHTKKFLEKETFGTPSYQTASGKWRCESTACPCCIMEL